MKRKLDPQMIPIRTNWTAIAAEDGPGRTGVGAGERVTRRL